MKKLRLYLLPLAAILLLASCDSSSSDKGYEPQTAKANLNYEVSLEYFVHHVSNPATGEVFTDVDYSMDNVAALVCVVHDATTGKYVQMLNMPKEMIAEKTKDKVTKFTDELPLGKYYVTMVVMTENQLSSNLLKALTQDYAEAACQVPNEHIFYNTYEVNCMPESGVSPEIDVHIDFKLEATLQCITGEYVFSVNEIEQIPANANFSMDVEVKDVPAAIFIKTGKTLSVAEVDALGMKKFGSKRTIADVAELNKSSIIAKVYCLTSSHLNKEDRGTISFVYKEDAASDVPTQQMAKAIPERKDTDLGYYDVMGLYSGVPEVNPIESMN